MNNEGICRTCAYANNRFGDMCYCAKYGFIIGHTKRECRGYENDSAEQVREQEMGTGREKV